MTGLWLTAKTLIIGLGFESLPILKAVHEQFQNNQADSQLRILHVVSEEAAGEEYDGVPASGYHSSIPGWYTLNEPLIDQPRRLSRLYFANETRIWCAPHWKKWGKSHIVNNRLYGKMWIQDYLQDVRDKLDFLPQSTPAVQENPRTAPVLTQDETNIFLVVPLMDTFASGMWLDVAYLLQDKMGRTQSQNRCFGMLLLPTPDQYPTESETGIQRRQWINANVYAALRELQFVIGVPSQWQNHNRHALLTATNRPPFSPGGLLMLGGSRNEHDDQQPLTREKLKRQCALTVFYAAQGAMHGLSPREQVITAAQTAERIRNIAAHVQPVLPTVKLEEIRDVIGVSSLDVYEHKNALQQDEDQESVVLAALLDKLVTSTERREQASQASMWNEQVMLALAPLRDDLTEMRAMLYERGGERAFNDAIEALTAAQTTGEQDAGYAQAMHALLVYERAQGAEIRHLIDQSSAVFEGYVNTLIKGGTSLNQIRGRLGSLTDYLKTEAEYAAQTYESKLRDASAAIAHLKDARARRFAFLMQPAYRRSYQVMLGLLVTMWVIVFLVTSWFDLGAVLGLGVCGVLFAGYGVSTRTEYRMKDRLLNQQRDLLQLHKSVVDAFHQKTFWIALYQQYGQSQDASGVENQNLIVEYISDLESFQLEAAQLRDRLTPLLPPDEDQVEHKRRVDAQWRRMEDPVGVVFKAWREKHRQNTLDTLHTVLQGFGKDHQLYSVGERARENVIAALKAAYENAACSLRPLPDHISVPKHLQINWQQSGDGLTLISGLMHLKTGKFYPIPAALFDGSENNAITPEDLPQPLSDYRVAAIRLHGGIPLASLADLPVWYGDYEMLGSFRLDGENDKMVRQRAFFHPTRDGLASPDLIRQGANPMLFPYLMLTAALVRYVRDARVWTRFAQAYQLSETKTPVNVSELDRRLPISLDELCSALHEKLNHEDTVLLPAIEASSDRDAQKAFVIQPRPSGWSSNWEFFSDPVGKTMSSDVEDQKVVTLRHFLTERTAHEPTEITAPWEVWVLNLLSKQLEQNYAKEETQRQRRYLIQFVYQLYQDWIE